MKHTDKLGIIPTRYTGAALDTDAVVRSEDITAAKAFFKTAKSRLLGVNNWHQVAGFVSAVFQVTDAAGNTVDRDVAAGDYLKIDIPGPGSREGDGYDWVLVEMLKALTEGENETIGFRVRPAGNPLNLHTETAHFYAPDATSSFFVMRRQQDIIAWIVDHNLKPNDEAVSLTDRLRHAAVGTGAIGLFSKIQWQGLADGIVQFTGS